MNEQIGELMAQAGFDPAAIERMGVMPNAEKFAELLIEQCYLYISAETGLMWDGGLKKTKQHFGVGR